MASARLPRTRRAAGRDPVERSPLAVRREPGTLPAAILAILVHAGFIGVIVFGVSWQVQHPLPVVAELWDQLPPSKDAEPAPAPPPPPPPPVEPEKKIEPVESKPAPPQPTKAEIALKARKEKAEREKLEKAERDKKEKAEREKQEKAEKQKQAEADKKRREDEARRKAVDDKARAEKDAREAAAASARTQAINDYGARIAALIRNRANIPDSVSGKPVLTVRLRLLVNGAVFDAQVVKPSGNRVYDEAVERAINGIQNWPLPQNAELLGGRRELILNIEHER